MSKFVNSFLNFSRSFLRAAEGIDGNVRHFTLKPNDGFIQPGGTPHCVMTTEDSVAFSCNFISMCGLPQAVQRYSDERGANLDDKSCFPNFEVMMIMLIYAMMKTNFSHPEPKIFERSWKIMEGSSGALLSQPPVLKDVNVSLQQFFDLT